MASSKGHPFWIDLLEMIKKRKDVKQRVEYCTGPVVLTEAVRKLYHRYPEISVVDPETFYLCDWTKPGWKELEPEWNKDSEEFKLKHPQCHAITFWTHTW
jgi:hypothetical protein